MHWLCTWLPYTAFEACWICQSLITYTARRLAPLDRFTSHRSKHSIRTDTRGSSFLFLVFVFKVCSEVLLLTHTSMPVCSSDWSWTAAALPGSECRELDFSLVFSSLLLSTIPSICFLVLGGYRIYYVKQNKVCIGRNKASIALWTAKLLCASLGIVGSLISLIGWLVEGSESGYGIAAVVLSLLASVCHFASEKAMP